jgi:protein-disulfide isomerase
MAKLTLPVGARDHVQGAEAAPVTLVEYGDYECPHCGAAYPVVQKLQEKLGKKLRFVFRNFPLNSIHPHAEHAAEAAEAAGLQGKFWEMHDWIFEHQDALEDRDLQEAARALGLDAGKFLKDMQSQALTPRVKEDFQSGVRSGVNGTPTFFINGIRHERGAGYEDLLPALQAAAGKA